MTERPVTLEKLVQTREHLIDAVVGQMPAKHREFLIGFEQGGPDWSLLQLSEVDRLPAVRWRIENMARVSDTKRGELVENLSWALGLRSA